MARSKTASLEGLEPTSGFQHADKLSLKDFIKSVAKEVLVSEQKPPESAEAKSLGYAGAEAMVVFPYNCPTMTVTALWISGKWQGGDWLPLVERSRRTDSGTGQLAGEDA
jgi:hypothetical protein